MLCLKHSVFTACTVYFTFRDVGTWEPFAENMFASAIDIIQKQRVEVQQAVFLKPDVQSFITIGKYLYEGEKKEVLGSNEEINPFRTLKV